MNDLFGFGGQNFGVPEEKTARRNASDEKSSEVSQLREKGYIKSAVGPMNNPRVCTVERGRPSTCIVRLYLGHHRLRGRSHHFQRIAHAWCTSSGRICRIWNRLPLWRRCQLALPTSASCVSTLRRRQFNNNASSHMEFFRIFWRPYLNKNQN